ncbi:hypothetical protein ABLN64_03580, partial [Mycobacterium tuberculosis]
RQRPLVFIYRGFGCLTRTTSHTRCEVFAFILKRLRFSCAASLVGAWTYCHGVGVGQSQRTEPAERPRPRRIGSS